MLEIISGLMFGVGLAMFEWGLSQRNARLETEKKVKRGRSSWHCCDSTQSYCREQCRRLPCAKVRG